MKCGVTFNTLVCTYEISVSWRMKLTVLWDVALCSVAEIGQCFSDGFALSFLPSLSLSLQFLLSKTIPSALSIPVHYILKHKEQSTHFVAPLPSPRILVLSRSLAKDQETNRWAVNISMEHEGKSRWVSCWTYVIVGNYSDSTSE
jgi:hypothetical protein